MNLRQAIQQMAMSGAELYCKVCTVDAVDEDARTIDCTPIDEGAPLLGVNLQADQEQEVGVVQFPAEGSDVVVAFLSANVAVVVLATEITKTILTIGDTETIVEDNSVTLTTKSVSVEVKDKTAKINVDGTTVEFDGNTTTFNGGSETMANATNLKQQLTTMSGRIDAIINAISSAPVAPMDGGATFKASMAATLAPHLANKENFSQMIDDKIKH
ncbi:MAG: hypothetical protein IKV09_02640 [Alistipes sp.]|nr:hypothetical protein [Alistipes sp.]